MRIVIAAVTVTAIGLIAAGVLGVAGAETTPTPPATVAPRTVSVQGVAGAPIEATASVSAATAVYRQAMAAAVGDGQTKAQFLAEKTGSTLGQVQSIGEGGGYIQCPGEEEYQGAQPDFGSASPGFASAPVALAKTNSSVPVHKAPTTNKKKQHGKKRHPTAKKASVEACTLSTQVALIYQLG